MKKNHSWRSLIVAVMAITLLLTGCTGSGKQAPEVAPPATSTPVPAQPDANKPVVGGTLTIGTTSDIGTLNPMMFDDTASGDVINMLFAYLYDWDKTGQLAVTDWSLAAELPQVSTDGKLYTVKLRSTPKWSDGTPVTAQDVAYTLNTIANEKTASPNYGYYATIKEARVKDPTTVEVELKDADSRFALNVLANPIVPAKSFANVKVEEIANDPFGKDIAKTLTNGPYLWKEWVEKQYIRVEANPNYWGKKPNIQTVIFKIYASQDTAVQAIMQGEVDYLENSPVSAQPALKGQKGLTVFSAASGTYDYFGFNFKPENFPDKFVPFASAKSRQAIGYAINRKGMVDSILNGYGTLLDGPFLATSWAFTKDASFSYAYDPAKAKQLLAEDGWKAGADGILMKENHKFEFDMFVASSSKRRLDYSQVIQQNLKDVGIKVNVKPMDFSSLIAQYVTPGKFQVYLGGWQLGLDPDGESIFSSAFFPDAGQNSGFYKNEKTDKLWLDGYKTADLAKRKAIYADIAKEYNNDPPYIFLCQPNMNIVYNERVHWADADKPVQSLPYGYEFHLFNWWVTEKK